MPEVATEYIRECAKFKMTALALAIANGHEEAAKMLIEPIKAAGALNVQDGAGRSALMIAAGKGLISITRQLLAAGAKPELTDANDMTALAHACVLLGNTKRLSGSRVTAAETAATLAVGCWVKVTATFTSVSEIPVKVSKGSLGKVVKIDYEGGCALLDFDGIGEQWVSKNDGDSISVLSQDHVVKGEAGQMYLALPEEVLKRRAQREEMVLMLIELTQAASALDVPNNEGSTVLMHACKYGLCGVATQLLDAGRIGGTSQAGLKLKRTTFASF